MEKATNTSYTQAPYQTLCATKMMASTAAMRIMELGPGQGKSFVIILCANYIMTWHPERTVVVMVSNELVK